MYVPATNLSPSEVHIWQFMLDLPADLRSNLRLLLDDEELKRADRLLDREAAGRFINCRGLLRQVLSAYCGTPPGDIRLSYGPFGKPCLEADSPLRFNLSHSRNLAVLAVAMGTEVGIDIEAVDPALPYGNISRTFFSRDECAYIEGLPDAHRLAAFYECWTCKEAYQKGCGAGFSLPSDCFTIVFPPGRDPEMASHRIQPDETRRWTFHKLPLRHGFSGALAIEGKAQQIRMLTSEGKYFTEVEWP
ncbi:4'-phosphopantetheinyl transferase superfamily protein [Geobacter sp. DSM 9736]|uniref:4'-phosphopantetheinyl transferase family protein n=1 Tax=Geobacter sp. DSM 9736 TaxID=1277350 RepID=UPI000B50A824|nr:4'-phosphopantetheinyl transferase superfamily protein [Geobacter sp. DSM 9736]SNB46817.1 4'-phosphopantetheinyl transferase [Geobacter sp. DSM 9736]